MPRVDVGVVTWNTADVTVAALRRLLDADQGVDLRLLVRDNASRDGTAEAIRAAIPEADLDAGDRNLGFAAGMNTLIARSDALYFFALNSDAWPRPGALAALVEAAERRPNAAALAPRLQRPDGELEHSTHPFPSLRLAALVAVGGQRLVGASRRERLLLEGSWHHDRPRAVDWAVGAALLMRRAALDAVGGFDERYFMYVEDLEWWWGARQRGWEIWFEPAAVVEHVGNASGAQAFGDARTEEYFRNTYRFFREEHGRTATAVYRALNLAGSVRNYLVARIAGNHWRARHWRSQVGVHVHRR